MSAGPYVDSLLRVRERYDAHDGRHREAIRVIDRAVRLLARIPPHAQDRVAAALAVRAPGLAGVLGAPAVSPLCSAYPRTSLEWQARIVLGERPTQILRGFSASEAHHALAQGVSSETEALDWLLSDVVDDVHVQHVAVARWLLACCQDPDRRAALEAHRVHRGPHGEEIHGRLLDRVDEIGTRDLPRGVTTGVREAFESAARRAYERWAAEAEKQHEPLAPRPAWWRPIRCARLLLSAAELVSEGRALSHCVGSYATYVRSGRSVIISICVVVRGETHRSTAEIDRSSLRVRQHKGAKNSAPPELCVRALEVVLRRSRAGLGGGLA